MNHAKADRKTNRGGDPEKSNLFDRCQTPGYAVDAILPYLRPGWLIWEPAAGEGGIVNRLRTAGFGVIGTDLLQGVNYFDFQPARYDAQVTNPPFSIKYDWLGRAYQLGKPFALLMQVEAMGAAKAQRLFERHGIEIVLLNRRVNFKMPLKGWQGKGAQFPVCWYTWGLGIGQQLSYAKIVQYPNEQMRLMEAA